MEGNSFKSFLKKALANGELAPLRLFKKVYDFYTQANMNLDVVLTLV